MSSKNLPAALACALVALTPAVSRANILFQFSQVGADVVMTSHGTLDTTKLLVSTFPDGWGGVGIENNSSPGDIDIMGGTSFGDVDTLFRFSSGTDAGAITAPGGPFTFDHFAWTVTGGSKSFATYAGFDGGLRQPGIGLVGADIVGGLWTPDQTWIKYGDTFASLGLNVGTYSVVDGLTGESITIQIGASAVPEGGAVFAMLGGALLTLAALRRRFIR